LLQEVHAGSFGTGVRKRTGSAAQWPGVSRTTCPTAQSDVTRRDQVPFR